MARRNREFIGTEDLALLLGVPERTVRAWRYQGKGPRGYNFGGRNVRYDLTEVERWIEAQADPEPSTAA